MLVGSSWCCPTADMSNVEQWFNHGLLLLGAQVQYMFVRVRLLFSVGLAGGRGFCCSLVSVLVHSAVEMVNG